MEMTFEERNSALWVKLKEHLTARLDLLRRKNDSPLSPEETSSLRGAIREVKTMLALEQSGTAIDVD